MRAISVSRPTNRVKVVAPLACNRVRACSAPVSSKTWIGSARPLIGTSPSASKASQPAPNRAVASDTRVVPGRASCSSREARCTVGPIASYSTVRSLPIERTMTSPELMPMRIIGSMPMLRRSSAPTSAMASWIASAA